MKISWYKAYFGAVIGIFSGCLLACHLTVLESIGIVCFYISLLFTIYMTIDDLKNESK